MICPNCKTEMTPQKIGSTVYWACPKCHTLWFDNKESDFLSIEETETLVKMYSKSHLPNKDYRCPRDNRKLSKNTYHYHCYQCGGLLTTPAELKREKEDKARQFAKDMRTQKGLPLRLSDLRSVVIVMGVLLFAGVNTFIFTRLNKKISVQSQAQEIESQIRFQKVNNDQLAIFFTTAEPYASSVKFNASGETWTETISEEPTLAHFLIVKAPPARTMLEILLEPVEGQEFTTAPISVPEN